jgi:hypothetical protein
MSRVDDDRQAQRAAERLMLEKRQQEQRTEARARGETAFAKLVSEGQSQQATTADRGKGSVIAQAQQAAREAARLRGEAGLVEKGQQASAQQTDQEGHKGADAGRTRRQGAAVGEQLERAQAGAGERAGEARAADTAGDGRAVAGRSGDSQGTALRAEARREDARKGEGAFEEKGEAATSSRRGGATPGGKSDLKADRDGGGQKNSGGGKDSQSGSGDVPPGFRFNPALMAPVPVAQPKQSSASERLRALANEIAQKIVKSVRVGTNAAGMAEFQIDLRSEVLAGLSIKVSGSRGRIKAVFAGSDREVLKLLGDNQAALKEALRGRGLSLEELRIEVRS